MPRSPKQKRGVSGAVTGPFIRPTHLSISSTVFFAGVQIDAFLMRRLHEGRRG